MSGNCEMCKKRIEKAALTVKGVKTASWDIPSNVISVIYDSKQGPFTRRSNVQLLLRDTILLLSKAPDGYLQRVAHVLPVQTDN